MTGWDGQVDHIYLHRVLRFDPDPALSEEELAAEHVHELRWWPLSTLLGSDATFSPRALATLLPDLLEDRSRSARCHLGLLGLTQRTLTAA